MIGQNLGVIANIRGDLDVALRYYEASLASYRSLGLANDVCVALNNLGKLHTDTARWADAHRAYSEALQIPNRIDGAISTSSRWATAHSSQSTAPFDGYRS